MINRVLIRIKVVQLLYSYLLIENPFSLESQPSAPTKEKRFAYNLYLDLLELMTRLSKKIYHRGLNYPMSETRFIRKVLSDDKIKSLQIKNKGGHVPFESAEEELIRKIKESGIYKLFIKSLQNKEVSDDNVWKDLFEQIILQDPLIISEIAGRENYSLRGVDRMREMMDVTFSNFFASADHIGDALKILEKSLQKSRELYFRLLILPIAITDLRERDIDNARHKFIKTDEDINPNLRFTDNDYVRALRQNEELNYYESKYGISWLPEDENMVRSLLRKIMDSELYKEYMSQPVTDFKTDCAFWKNIYKYIILPDIDFQEVLEDKSVFWNDDLDVIGTFVLKTVKRYEAAGPKWHDSENLILPMYKDEEDSRFGAELFSDVVRKKDYYREMINANVDIALWEIERLAFMDVVIIMTALAEIMEFPKIPLTVSFNEYIEIAKDYSTPKSGIFVNGLLGNIVEKLQKEGKILKKF